PELDVLEDAPDELGTAPSSPRHKGGRILGVG
ncbi:hypothetical protein ACVMDO_000353, partial [Bradyrhizobium sp. USDA 4513]